MRIECSNMVRLCVLIAACVVAAEENVTDARVLSRCNYLSLPRVNYNNKRRLRGEDRLELRHHMACHV